MRTPRWRVKVEAAAGVIAAVLAILTMVWKEWIEVVFRVDPDHHSGALEWAIVAGLVAVAVICTSLARRDWRLATA